MRWVSNPFTCVIRTTSKISFATIKPDLRIPCVGGATNAGSRIVNFCIRVKRNRTSHEPGDLTLCGGLSCAVMATVAVAGLVILVHFIMTKLTECTSPTIRLAKDMV